MKGGTPLPKVYMGGEKHDGGRAYAKWRGVAVTTGEERY